MLLPERWEWLIQDTRYAAHGLLRDPLMTGFVVVTSALGIGANVTRMRVGQVLGGFFQTLGTELRGRFFAAGEDA